MAMNTHIDSLTKLHRKSYLVVEYDKYLKNHKNVYMITIDFTKLKYINDNFGHQEGDNCLKYFSKIIRTFFPDSILIRLYGDEFTIVTNSSTKEIQKKLELIDIEIKKLFDRNLVKCHFHVNSGIVRCEANLEETLRKSDNMMYYAKEKGKSYHFYDDEIYQEKLDDENFIDKVDELVENKKLKFSYQSILNVEKEKQEIIEIYGRDEEFKTLFSSHNYDLLNRYYRLKKIDLLVLNMIFIHNDKIEDLPYKIMINLNSQLFFSQELDFFKYLEEKLVSEKLNPKKYIISVGIQNFHDDLYELIRVFNRLKEIGFEICLDSYQIENASTVLGLISNAEIDYIKISKKYFTASMKNKRDAIMMNGLMNILEKLDIKSIFSNIETKDELESAKKICNKLYVKGNYISDEKKIKC